VCVCVCVFAIVVTLPLRVALVDAVTFSSGPPAAAPIVLLWCFVMLLWCLYGVTVVLPWCHYGVTMVFIVLLGYLWYYYDAVIS
jgi:hypothetical protein